TAINTVQTALASGYAGGAWTGTGIASASAAATAGTDHPTALGYALSSDVLGGAGGPFSGQTVDGNATLVRYTDSGDADLNGVVDSLDFARLAGHFGNTNEGWSHGDFNFDGVVDTTDFNLLAANFGQTLPGATPAGSAGVVSVGTLVPEPASAALGAAEMLMLALGRRHRRKMGM